MKQTKNEHRHTLQKMIIFIIELDDDKKMSFVFLWRSMKNEKKKKNDADRRNKYTLKTHLTRAYF